MIKLECISKICWANEKGINDCIYGRCMDKFGKKREKNQQRRKRLKEKRERERKETTSKWATMMANAMQSYMQSTQRARAYVCVYAWLNMFIQWMDICIICIYAYMCTVCRATTEPHSYLPSPFLSVSPSFSLTKFPFGLVPVFFASLV